VARCLQECYGVTTNTIVGLSSERSGAVLIALLGVLKAGGAYLPLDPKYPDDRLSLLVQDAKVRLVLSTSDYEHRFLQLAGLSVLTVDAHVSCFASFDSRSLRTSCSPSDLAYVLYTSGSTGVPKGVMVPHLGVCHFVSGFQQIVGLVASDRYIHVSSLTFDASVMEMWSTWSIGAALIVCDIFADNLSIFFNSYRISMVLATPSFFSVLKPADVQTAKVCFGGERVSLALIRAWARDGRTLYNAYGPTECSAVSNVTVCSVDMSDASSIGPPLRFVREYVLDEYMRPVPIGILGELYIGGPQVSHGYLNQADKTAASFIANPFQPGERMYKTGDLCRWLPDGSIGYIGRADFQVKISGQRVELGEIEFKLAEVKGIQRCCVLLREDTPGQKVLVAYVQVGEQDLSYVKSAEGQAELRNHARQYLPRHMVPTFYLALASFPLSTSGKINRALLPPVATTSLDDVASVSDEKQAPRSPAEDAIRSVMATVLNVAVSSVGVTDNFYSLGGNSLSAIAY